MIMELLSQVSKLCGSKFQAAFRRQKQYFPMTAVSFDSFLLLDARGIKL